VERCINASCPLAAHHPQVLASSFPCQKTCQSARHIIHMRRNRIADSVSKSWPGACMLRTASGLQPFVDLCSPILRGSAEALVLACPLLLRNICNLTAGRQRSVRCMVCGKDAALAAPHAQQMSSSVLGSPACQSRHLHPHSRSHSMAPSSRTALQGHILHSTGTKLSIQ